MKKMRRILIFLLLLTILIQPYKTLNVYAAKSGPTVKTEMSFEAFAKAICELIKKYNIDLGNIGDITDRFFSKRLIVKLKNSNLSFDKYHPLAVVKGPQNLCVLQFSTKEEAKSALQKLSKSSAVKFVEADGVFSTNSVSSEASQHKSWGVAKMNADSYANYVSSVTKQSIKVAVVDTGVSSHSFLSGRIADGGYDFVGLDSSPSDLNGHGTHVAGTIVDCTPGLNVKILPVRVLDQYGSGYNSVVASGIRYAADHGAKVINLSLGGSESSLVDEMITYAVNKGSTVVVAAGNEGSSTSRYCPSHLKSAIVVGAVDSQNKKAYFSNTGSSLDVVAPGVDITSCVPGGGYATYSGTSMAAPHVSAVAAMFQLVYPGKTPSQIEQLIKANTKDLGVSGWDSSYGNGIPSLASGNTPQKVTLNKTSAALKAGNAVTLKASVLPADADQAVTWESSNTAIAAVANGKVEAKAPGTVSITAKTSNGKTAVCKVTVTKKTVKPQGITLDRESAAIAAGENLTLSATITPADASNKSVAWSSSNPAIASVQKGNVTGNAPGTATITAKTGNGKTAKCVVTVKAASVSIKLDKDYYTCKSGEKLQIRAEIILPEKPVVNQRKYVLYIANMGYGWKELGSYNICGAQSCLEPRNPGVTEITSCNVQGNKLIVHAAIDTRGMKASAIVRLCKFAIFPYDDFNAGKSLHDEIFFLKIQ